MDFQKLETKFQELDNGSRMQSPALEAQPFASAGENRAFKTYAEERIFSGATPAQAQAVVERDIKRFPQRYQ